MFSQLLSKWHFILRICKDILKQYFFFLYHLSSAWLAAVVPPPLLCLLSKQKSLLLQHEGELCWLKKELVNNQLNSDFSKTTSTQTIYNSIKKKQFLFKFWFWRFALTLSFWFSFEATWVIVGQFLNLLNLCTIVSLKQSLN